MTTTTKKPAFILPVFFALLVGMALGYGVSHYQASQANQALQEKLETTENSLKIATEATAAVEKQSARLLGRRYLDASLRSLNQGDEQGARASLVIAGKSFRRGEISSSRALTDQIDALLKGHLAGKQKSIEGIASEFDASITSPTTESGGAR